MEAELWRKNHGGCIMAESSVRRLPRSGSQEEAVVKRQPGGTRRYPRGTRRQPPRNTRKGTRRQPRRCQEAHRRHPGGTQICICVYVCICTYSATFTTVDVSEGPRCRRAEGQRLKDPRWPQEQREAIYYCKTMFVG